MDTDVKKLKDLLKLMKKEGVLSLKMGEIELSLSEKQLKTSAQIDLKDTPILSDVVELSDLQKEECVKLGMTPLDYALTFLSSPLEGTFQ